MNTINSIYWKNVLAQIKAIHAAKIDFNGETIHWTDAALLGKAGIVVPQDMIDYDEENIDFSDIPEITSENNKNTDILNKEIRILLNIKHYNYLQEQNIDIYDFFNKLIEQQINQKQPNDIKKAA